MSKMKRIIIALIMVVVLLGASGFTYQPAQASGCSYYHTVRAGQSLSGIARGYGAYWPYLAQINHIPPPAYKIYPGQVLCIAFSGSGYQPPYYPPSNNYPTYPTYPTTPYYGAYWSFTIINVQPNSTVSIRTANFPSNVLFKAKMGRNSGGGVQWKDLPDVDSGNGGSFEVTFNIPAEFANAPQLVVRLIQEKKNGKVFHYDQWFNNTVASSGTGGQGAPYYPHNYSYGYIPTIWIVGVARDSSVTIQTANFPANLDFQVLMGPMGTRGQGYHVATFNSGSGGSMKLTFPIPPQLYGSYQISIRTQNLWSGYFSYNWFYNNTTY